MLGGFYSAQPKMLGDKTAINTLTRLLRFPDEVAVHVILYAKFYAYQIQDRDLFVKTLEMIMATPG